MPASSPYALKPKRGERAGRPISGTKIIRSSSARAARSNVYPNKGPYVNNPSKRPNSTPKKVYDNRSIVKRVAQLQSKRRPTSSKNRRMTPRSATRPFITSAKKNVYWGKVKRPREKATTRDISGRRLRTRNFRTPPLEKISARDPYLGRPDRRDKANKSSPSFLSSPRRGLRAWTGDVSGHPIRKKSSRLTPQIAGKQFYPRQFSISAKARKSNASFRSKRGISISGSQKDNRALAAKIPSGGAGIASYKGSIKQSNFFSRQGIGFSGNSRRKRTDKGGGSVSGQFRNNKPLPTRIPPPDAAGAGKYQGNLRASDIFNYRDQGEEFAGFKKAKRPFKGGGSISGKLWNNNRSPISVKIPGGGAARAGTYQGNLRVSDRFNYRDQGEEFAGFRKAGKPIKGGGSISGKLWNNKRNPIAVRTPSSGAARAGTYQGNLKVSDIFKQRDQGEEFAGFMKTRKPIKGGGSISGKLWNNKRNPIAVRTPSSGAARAGTYQGNLKVSDIFKQRDQGEEFAGFMKARKPIKGGGSISGKLWNNRGKAIAVRIPSSGAAKAGTYQGNIKAGKLFNYLDQGEEFTGFMKAKKPVKGGGSISGKLWNNKGKPINVRTPLDEDAKAANYSGKIKRKFSYIQNSKASLLSLKKKEPTKESFRASGLQIKVKSSGFEKKPKAKEGALLGLAPKSSTVKASEYEGRMKMIWSYKHNSSSSKEARDVIRPNNSFGNGNSYQGRARLTKSYRLNPHSNKQALKVIYPGRAYARIGDYQGNMKMHKGYGGKLHPDAKFAHGNENNVKSERTIFTNVKLFWSRIFKKNDNQPAAVKTKVRRPRYDKKESELWKDLY